MILEEIIDGKGNRSLTGLLEELLEPGNKKHASDDIRVRAYVVRSHWRKRWFPNGHRKKIKA